MSILQIEQAVFTSLKASQRDGYQLAAASPGVMPEIARELSAFGPTHDSLSENRPGFTSVNFRCLENGSYSISKTSCAGAEYSERGGGRVYTQYLIVDPRGMERFAFNPFALLEAVVASGQMAVAEEPPEELDSISLVGSASRFNQRLLVKTVEALGIIKMSALLNASLNSQMLGVVCDISTEHLFSTLINLIPPSRRKDFSFSTGLKYSPRRPYRWLYLPHDNSGQRQVVRQSQMTRFDITLDPPREWMVQEGWAMLIRELLEKENYEGIQRLFDKSDGLDSVDLSLNEAAAQHRYYVI